MKPQQPDALARLPDRTGLTIRARPHHQSIVLGVWPVDRRVGSPRNNGPKLLATIAA
jgi:hypothetical protein